MERLIAAAMVLACAFWLMGCVPAFLGGKANPKQPEKGTAGTELLKPQVTEAPESHSSPIPPDRKSVSPVGESGREVRPAGQSDEQRTPTQAARAGAQEASSAAEETKKDRGGTSDRPSKKISGDASVPEVTEKKEKPESDEASDDSADGPTKDSFKKHDHEKYVESVRDKATEEVNRDSKCDLARLCRNSVTDEWSLTVYYVDGKTYSFVTYVWDEIDEKWKKGYTSTRWPISQWEEHLKLSSARQDCKVIKERRR